jgi:dipeptidyl aminopeptidase/acylaminoacyl peptidase
VPVRPAEAFAESLEAKGMAVKVQIFPHAKHGMPINDQFRKIYPFLEEAIL